MKETNCGLKLQIICYAKCICNLHTMSLLVPGLKSPGKESELYLQPLVDELKELWNYGVRTYDSVSGDYFQLYASLLWTINDFLVLRVIKHAPFVIFWL